MEFKNKNKELKLWLECLNLQLKIDGKTYLASSNQKKAAKQVL